jgi:hypothetical protein
MTSVCVAIMAVALAAEPAETPLNDLGGILQGRWIGDVTLIADWPGLGKRGEKVVAYVNADWIVDGHAFEIVWHGGAGCSKEIFVWDAGAKKVRSTGASSGGSSWQTTWSKKGDNWLGRSVEHLADGTKAGGNTIVLTVEDNGKRLVFTSEGDGYIGDKKLDPLRDVYTKLDTEAPEDTLLQEYGDLVVGRWMGDIELVRDWPGVGMKGDKNVAYSTIKWTADRRAFIVESSGGQAYTRTVHFWDPVEKKIKLYSLNSGGTSFTALVDKDGDKWVWTLTGSLYDGTPETGTGTVEFSEGGNKYVVAGDLVVGGEKVSFSDPYTRLSE